MVDFVDSDDAKKTNVALLGFGPPRDDGSVGFGWIVAPTYWRRGISEEASRLALDWFFDNFDLRVVTETIPENIASRKASEKLGFSFVSDDGKEYVYAITPAEWKSRRK